MTINRLLHVSLLRGITTQVAIAAGSLLFKSIRSLQISIERQTQLQIDQPRHSLYKGILKQPHPESDPDATARVVVAEKI
jgi:hypothetical protein